MRSLTVFAVAALLAPSSTHAQHPADPYLQYQHAAMIGFQRHLTDGAADSLTLAVRAYLASDKYNAMVGHQMAGMLVAQGDHLDLSQVLIERSLERNGPEVLGRLHPGMANAVKVAQLNMELHSLMAWLEWKRDRPEAAQEHVRLSLELRDQHAQPSDYGRVRVGAEDLVRMGLVAAAAGSGELGWTRIAAGLLLDDTVLSRDPSYSAAVAQLVTARFGHNATTAEAISRLQRQASRPLPDMSLTTAVGETFTLAPPTTGRPAMVVFFSPACGSCQQELSAIGPRYAEFAGVADVVLVLNRPDFLSRARAQLDGYGLGNAPVVWPNSGSGYDYIPAEPSTWLVDTSGAIAYTHLGYAPGDEDRYLRELTSLAAAP